MGADVAPLIAHLLLYFNIYNVLFIQHVRVVYKQNRANNMQKKILTLRFSIVIEFSNITFKS